MGSLVHKKLTVGARKQLVPQTTWYSSKTRTNIGHKPKIIFFGRELILRLTVLINRISVTVSDISRTLPMSEELCDMRYVIRTAVYHMVISNSIPPL